MSSAIDIMKIPDSTQVWVVSDLHINHKNILEYAKRPFKTLEEHNEAIIKGWQETVGPDDLVLLLGDVMLGPKAEMAKYLNRLTGHIILVRGNHDQAVCKLPELNVRFEMVTPYLEVAHRGDCAALSHFPIEVWNNAQRGFWQLHGHSHGTSRKIGRWLDVGLDAFCRQDFRPRSWQDVAKYMETQIYMAQDHHEER